MPRIRTIKPSFWSSEQVMDCSPLARLLFIGMWNFCDDHGRHPLGARTLKALVFPGDSIEPDEIEGLVKELSSTGLILIYSHAGKEYFEITGWHHQKIDNPSKHGYFPGPFADEKRVVAEPSPSAPLALDESSPNSRSRDYRIGEEKKEKNIRAVGKPTRPSTSDLFERFKRAYPKREGANPWPPAFKAFEIAVRQGADPERMIAAAQACVGIDPKSVGTCYVPQAVKWIRDRRWEEADALPSSVVPFDSPGLEWISSEDDRWGPLADRYRREKGKSPPLDRNVGWQFPKEWFEEIAA